MKQSEMGWHQVMGQALFSYLLSGLILLPLLWILEGCLVFGVAYLLNLWDLRSASDVSPLSVLKEAFSFRLYLMFLQAFSMGGIILWTIGGTLWSVLWWIWGRAFGGGVRWLFWAYAIGLCMGCVWLFLGGQGFKGSTLLATLIYLPVFVLAFVLGHIFILPLFRVYNWLAKTDIESLWRR